MSVREQQLTAGIALVSTATLVYELAQIRIFAYSLHPVVAFSAIALAMLGFGLGATLLALRPRWSAGELGPRLGWLCVGLALSMVVVTALFARTSTEIIETQTLAVRPLWAVVVLLPSVVPYFLGGLVTALILGARLERIGRVYFWNLLGAAAGCVGEAQLLEKPCAPLEEVRVLGQILDDGFFRAGLRCGRALFLHASTIPSNTLRAGPLIHSA